MSEKNVEVVQASIDAWNVGDMDAFCALHDPNVIWARFEGLARGGDSRWS